jgi:hypothetical protein
MKAGELISLMRAMMSGTGVTNPSSFPSRPVVFAREGRESWTQGRAAESIAGGNLTRSG